jgi:hypothetical protein
MMTKFFSPLPLALALATACATPKYAVSTFDQREFQGRAVLQPAARVPLAVSGDDQVGTVDVATSGVFITQLGTGHGTPVVHVRLTIHNVDVSPMKVPLDLLTLDVGRGAPLQPAAVFSADREKDQTSVMIPAGQVADVDCVFTLPDGMDVAKLSGFSVAWGVDTAAESLRERTAFRSATDRQGITMAKAFRPAATTTM